MPIEYLLATLVSTLFRHRVNSPLSLGTGIACDNDGDVGELTVDNIDDTLSLPRLLLCPVGDVTLRLDAGRIVQSRSVKENKHHRW